MVEEEELEDVKDSKLIFLMIIILFAVFIIVILMYLRMSDLRKLTNSERDCISDSNIFVIISKYCDNCDKQGEILGGFERFKTLYISDAKENIFEKYNLKSVPTWVLGNETYPGVKSIKEIKEMTGC